MARSRLSTVGTAAFFVLFTATGIATANPLPRTIRPDDLFTALIEPNLRPDGRLPAGKREAILATARKLLDAPQLRELEQRLDSLIVAEPILHLDEPKEPIAPPLPNATAAPAAPPTLFADAPGPDGGKERLIDNLSVFVGLDGSKQPQDLGLNANMGGRTEINWGFPIFRRWGIGGQIGSSENYSDSAVHVVNQLEGPTTAGRTSRPSASFSGPALGSSGPPVMTTWTSATTITWNWANGAGWSASM